MSERQNYRLIAAGLLLALLFYLLSPILLPFLVAALLAYLGDPLVDRLELWRIPRSGSVVIVFVALFLILTLLALLLVPLLGQQLSALMVKLPLYLDYLQEHLLPRFSVALGLDPQLLDLSLLKKTAVDEWQKTGGLFASLLLYVSHSGLLLLAWLANLVLIPVVTFYLLRDWDLLIARLRELLPRSQEPTVSKLALESDQVLGAFLRGQMSVMAALTLIYSLGLWLAGVELALLIGTFAGLVSFVPYLGFILGLLLASVMMLFQQPELAALLPVLLVFVVGQVIEGAVLTPLLVGDRIGLHPVVVIFAVLAGGQLFGFVGVLLALPVAAVLAVLLRHAHEQYRQSEFYDADQALNAVTVDESQGDKA